MSTKYIKIAGSEIRKRLRSLGLPGGSEKVCCGGRVTFSRDYKSQLQTLKLRGNFKVTENGAIVDVVSLP